MYSPNAYNQLFPYAADSHMIHIHMIASHMIALLMISTHNKALWNGRLFSWLNCLRIGSLNLIFALH